MSEGKSYRILQLFDRLNRGEYLVKSKLANEFYTSEKSIQRDIEFLRGYYYEDEKSGRKSIIYDRSLRAYYLQSDDLSCLQNDEIMAIAKILLESRAFLHEEINPILEHLISLAAPNGKKLIANIIRNEQFHYIPIYSAKPILKQIWKLSEHIINKNIISFDYTRQDEKVVHRRVKPLSLMFSEFYFYLLAYFVEGCNDFPIVFRLDRIENISFDGEIFEIPYKDRFEEGEFRKKIQFMYTGELIRVKFKFWGPSLDAVLDRLPTAKIIGQDGEKTILEAEVFGKGIKMWLLSQWGYIDLIEPKSLRDEILSLFIKKED